MEFDDFVTRSKGATGGIAELRDRLLDIRFAHRDDRRIVRTRRGGGGSDRLPAALVRAELSSAFPRARGARFAAGMGELDCGDRAQRLDHAVDARPRLDVIVRPQPRVVG
ncbi:MAG TPA: hypothetical protein PKB10_03040 [Tepidisphaeraceae bacterium]|nr:hypothetical protein [Tepidisphaeraceae bacterium]